MGVERPEEGAVEIELEVEHMVQRIKPMQVMEKRYHLLSRKVRNRLILIKNLKLNTIP